MGDDSSVLSQAEIDALFRQATGTSITRPAAPAPPASPASITGPVSQVQSSDVSRSLQPQAAVPHMQRASVSTDNQPFGAGNTAEMKVLIHGQKSQLDELIRRVTKLEANLLAVSQSRSEGGIGDSIFEHQQVIELRATVRRMAKQTERIQKGLDGTPAYNLVHEFACTECGSEGHLAIQLTCTNCGKEGWWGWWPKNSGTPNHE